MVLMFIFSGSKIHYFFIHEVIVCCKSVYFLVFCEKKKAVCNLLHTAFFLFYARYDLSDE
ncbi:MAG TPA: hypothetical protein DHU85_09925 [Porphyromonadaceae bacterium]|nr:hypothetical protein [Porphyromonadaceae bacterium]